MNTTDIDLIKGGYESFAKLDIDDVLGRFADDMTWTVPEADGWGGTFVGREAIGGFFASLPGRYGFFEVKPDTFIASDGDELVVFGHHHIDGDTIPFCHRWVVRDGQARSFQEYVDNMAFLPHVKDSAVA